MLKVVHSLQVRLIEPKFDRLTVFDPRLPHGVRRVSGTTDPLQARLVLHGWFTDPQPFAEGLCPISQASGLLCLQWYGG